MISFDLKCAGGHIFEIWFRSSEDYERQRAGRHIACPTCGEDDVGKAVMAPAVSAKGNRRLPARQAGPDSAPDADAPADARLRALMHKMAEAQAQALKQSQWVGDNFAEQARAIYYGEAEHTAIHGTANAREARDMMEEGLPVAPLLVPFVPPDRTN